MRLSSAAIRFSTWQESPPISGDRVTVVELLNTDGFLIHDKHMTGRRLGVGTLTSYAAGHGGDVWFVRHDDGGENQAYCLTELERLAE